MTLDYSKHKSILLQTLKDIYSDTSIAPRVGFEPTVHRLTGDCFTTKLPGNI